jgi:hypothetical protein
MFEGLGVLVHLGLSGVGKHSFSQQNVRLVLNPNKQVKRLQALAASQWEFSLAPALTYTNKYFSSDSTRNSIYPSCFGIYDLLSSVAFTVGCIWRYAASLDLRFAIQNGDWSKHPNVGTAPLVDGHRKRVHNPWLFYYYIEYIYIFNYL